MSVRSSSHVAILGGGIIGLSTAYFLLKRGHRVTVLERGSVGHDSCARGSAGMICPSHFVPLAAPGMVWQGLRWMRNPQSPFYIEPRWDWELAKWGLRFMLASGRKRAQAASLALRDLSLLSRKLYLDWEAAFGSALGLQKRGLLMLCQTTEALMEEMEMIERAQALGIPAQALTAAEVTALDPNIQMTVQGGVYFPEDCHLDPGVLLGCLERAIHTLGGIIRYQSEVTSFDVTDRRVRAVRAGSTRFEADEFVICGGSWSPQMVHWLDAKLPMQPGKGYSLTLPRPPAVAEICSILVEARVAVTPMHGTMRFGGTMEMVGLNTEINKRRVQGIIQSAGQYFPQFRAEEFTKIQPWSGLRPCTPDGLPYLGRLNHYDNLTAATGHAMLGLSLAPATGWAIAELLSGETPAVLSPLFKASRFG